MEYLDIFIEDGIPDKDEMVKNAKNWWKPHKNINPLSWNDQLKEISFPFEIIDLPKDLTENCFREEFINDEIVSYLNKKLKNLKIKSPYFVKLLTRSPKDSNPSLKVENGFDIMVSLINSMRTFDDVVLLLKIPDKLKLVVRPYRELDKSREFRVFVENNKIIGISQQYYNLEIDYDLKGIEENIRKLSNEKIIPNCADKNFSVDIYVEKDKNPFMIELNPLYLSDPCLFEKHGEMNNRFLVNKKV